MQPNCTTWPPCNSYLMGVVAQGFFHICTAHLHIELLAIMTHLTRWTEKVDTKQLELPFFRVGTGTFGLHWMIMDETSKFRFLQTTSSFCISKQTHVNCPKSILSKVCTARFAAAWLPNSCHGVLPQRK